MNVDSIRGFVRDRLQRAADALGPRGSENNDGKPISAPLNFKRPQTLQEQIQRLVRDAVSREAAANDFETFEEADDFDVGDDFDPQSPYEMIFDPLLGHDVPRDRHSGLSAKDVQDMEDEMPVERIRKRLDRKKKPSGSTPAVQPTPPAPVAEKPVVLQRKEGDDPA